MDVVTVEEAPKRGLGTQEVLMMLHVIYCEASAMVRANGVAGCFSAFFALAMGGWHQGSGDLTIRAGLAPARKHR